MGCNAGVSLRKAAAAVERGSKAGASAELVEYWRQKIVVAQSHTFKVVAEDKEEDEEEDDKSEDSKPLALRPSGYSVRVERANTHTDILYRGTSLQSRWSYGPRSLRGYNHHREGAKGR